MEVFNKMILMNYFATLNPVAFTNALPGNIAQGLIWGIMALGVYITFRLLDFADLTVDGSFATGGAVTVMMTINGYNLGFTALRMYCRSARRTLHRSLTYKARHSSDSGRNSYTDSSLLYQLKYHAAPRQPGT